MTDPYVFANSQILNDGITCRARWKTTKGLWNPAMRLPAKQMDAIVRKIQQHPNVLAYEPRKLNWSGRLINQGSFWAGRQQLALMASRMATRPTRLQIGSLYLDADFNGLVPKEDDKYNLLPNEVSFDMPGDAPGLWKGAYQFVQGLEQGITVSDDRIDQPGFLVSVAAATGAVATFTFTNPGDAPCEAVFSFSLKDYPSTTIHIQNQSQDAPRAVVYTTDANGNGQLDERHGLVLLPGQNVIQIQSSTGALLSVATSGMQGSFYGTVFRWTGNEANRFNDSPLVWVPQRTGTASYIGSDGNLHPVEDGQARIGVPRFPFLQPNVGLILEQAGTNLLTSNQATGGDTLGNATGFGGGITISGSSTITASGTQYYQGVTSIEVVTPGATYGEGTQLSGVAGCAANTVYTFSAMVYMPNGVGYSVGIYDSTNAVEHYTDYVGTGGWQSVSNSVTSGANPATLNPYVRTSGTSVATFYLDALILEASPFATSWRDGARNADQAALWAPQNYISASRDFTGWTLNGTMARNALTAASDGLNLGQTVSVVASTDTMISPLCSTDIAPSSTPWTACVRAKLGTFPTNGALEVQLLDQSNNVIQTTTYPTSTLPASDWFTLSVTAAPSASVTGLKVGFGGGSNGTGTVVLESAWLTQGSFPGRHVYTNGSPIYKPLNAMEWPGAQWTQNGSITFTTVIPPTPAGNNIIIFGSQVNYLLLRLTYDGNNLYFDREITGCATGSGGVPGRSLVQVATSIDTNPHTYTLSWYNVTLANGTRSMLMSLYKDGVLLGTLDAASSFGATAWVAGERLWLSDGSTQATISNVALGSPTLPAGATLPAV